MRLASARSLARALMAGNLAPIPHVNTGDLVALLFEKQGSNGGIHATRHAEVDGFGATHSLTLLQLQLGE